MEIVNEYLFWKIAKDLIFNKNFDLIQIDERNNEIWLKGSINKKTSIVRLYQKGFDWANHLKKDVSFAIERIRKIQKMFSGKDIQLFNIYLAKFEPVDDWQFLKKPIVLKDKKTITTRNFYIDEVEREEKLKSVYDQFEMLNEGQGAEQDPELLEQKIQHLKYTIVQNEQAKKREMASLFNYGKPILTYFLIAINIIIFLLLESTGDSTDSLHLIEWGAKFNPFIMDGEWWRILSSMFLHVGMLHIFMNMLALYYLGTAVEKIYGSFKFFFIYFLSGVLGGLTSFAFNDSVAAGASGAIFGMFGALLYFGLMNRKVFLQTMGPNLLFIIGLNVMLGFSIPNIDMGAHLGGLIGGFVASAVVQLPKQKKGTYQLFGILAFGILLFSLTTYGIEQNKHDEILYFNRSVAHYEAGELEEARDDLLKAVELNDHFADAHYNLAIIYGELQDMENAYKHAERAAQIDSNNPRYQDLVKYLNLLR